MSRGWSYLEEGLSRSDPIEDLAAHLGRFSLGIENDPLFAADRAKDRHHYQNWNEGGSDIWVGVEDALRILSFSE